MPDFFFLYGYLVLGRTEVFFWGPEFQIPSLAGKRSRHQHGDLNYLNEGIGQLEPK